MSSDAGSPDRVQRNRALEELLEPLPIGELRERIDHALTTGFLELRAEGAHAIGERDELPLLIFALALEQRTHRLHGGERLTTHGGGVVAVDGGSHALELLRDRLRGVCLGDAMR